MGRRDGANEPRRAWGTRQWGMLAMLAAGTVVASVMLLFMTGVPIFTWLAALAGLALVGCLVAVWRSPA